MAARTEDANQPGDSDNDPGMEEMMEEFDKEDRTMRQEWRVEDLDYQPGSSSGDRAAPSGPQVSERSLAVGSGQVAVRMGTEEEKEQRGFYGSRKPRMLGEPYVPTEAEREEHEKSHLPWRSWCAACVGGGAPPRSG